MVGVVKSCCQHSLQDMHKPSPATVPSQGSSPDETASTRSRRWEQSFPCCQFEGLELEEQPCTGHTCSAQPGSAPAGPGIGLGQPELPGTHGHAGWEQVERPGLAAVPGLQQDTVPLFAWARCGRLPQLGTRRLVLFKRLLFSPCVFGKTRGEPGRGMRTTLASSALSFCCRGHLPGCTPSP